MLLLSGGWFRWLLQQVLPLHCYCVNLFLLHAHTGSASSAGMHRSHSELPLVIKHIHDVIVLPQQQPAIVKFARHPYTKEIHMECAQ